MLLLGLVCLGQDGATYTWRRLADSKVDLEKSKVMLDVAYHSMSFDAIRFQMKGAGLTVKKIVVNYKDGTSSEVKKKVKIIENQSSKTIVLPKLAKLVSSIEVHYTGKKESIQNAKIVLWALGIMKNNSENE